jgi:hypothetical protein
MVVALHRLAGTRGGIARPAWHMSALANAALDTRSVCPAAGLSFYMLTCWTLSWQNGAF